jgi:hypothetical protein
MKCLVSLLALALCFPLAAHADEASRRAKSEQLIALLHVDRLVTQVIDNVMKQSADIAMRKSGGKMTPAQQAALSDFQKKLGAVIEPQIGWKEVAEPEYVRLYASTYTDEELDAMLTFFKSPAGVAFLGKMSPINQQVTQLLQGKINELLPQVKQMFDDFEKTWPATPPATPSAAPSSTTPPGAASPQ